MVLTWMADNDKLEAEIKELKEEKRRLEREYAAAQLVSAPESELKERLDNANKLRRKC